MKHIKLPTLGVINKLLNYNSKTGEFTWKKDHNAMCRKGQVAGVVDKFGYRRIQIYGRKYAAHRLAWLVVHKCDPGVLTIDHKDRNKDNNIITNLRAVTQAKQNENKLPSRKGVSKVGNRFQARITVKGKTRSLGCFATIEEAEAAYIDAKIKEHGFLNC
jgi:hypothetical protein